MKLNQAPIPLLNPYEDLFQLLLGQDPQLFLSSGSISSIRKKLIWAYSWAIPNSEGIHAISRYSPLVEWGAGTGYWAWLLSQTGAQVLAFDREPQQRPHWYPIERGSETVLAQYSEHALLMCWPSFESEMASLALDAYQGKSVIYVGEWNGRTADRVFHQKLKTSWKQVNEIEIPRWPGFLDRIFFFNRL